MKKVVLLILILTLISFATGFVSGAKKLFPYYLAKTIYERLKRTDTTTDLKLCQIETLKQLPNSFAVFIGHAYGAPATSDIADYIAPNVERFLSEHKQLINSVIFTGDVFGVPSSPKWKKLYSDFENLDIHVAPGNHDILRPDSYEVFKNQQFIRQDYPYEITNGAANIIVSDSISNNWQVGSSLTELLQAQSSDVIIARHNIVVSELSDFANSGAGGSQLPTAQELANNTKTDQNVTWIMGDGGAFSQLPRSTCLQYKNHYFIVNGIGEVDGDTVMILHKRKLFNYQIN
jgi:hypothetical protein